MILHCTKKSRWEKIRHKNTWGEDLIETDGCIHCSSVEYFWRVAPNFKYVTDDMVLLCIDEDKLISEVRYEDGDNCGRCYPHIYGVINNSAIINTLPYLRDINGQFIKNPELMYVEDK